AVVHVDGTRWIDRHESDVPSISLERFDHFAGRIVEDQFHWYAEPPRELARQVDRHAARLPCGGIPRRKDRIAEVDCSAQLSAGSEARSRGRRRIIGHGRSGAGNKSYCEQWSDE